jgi:hypothetical protein
LRNSQELHNRVKVALGEDIDRRPKLAGIPSEGRTGALGGAVIEPPASATTTETTTVSPKTGQEPTGGQK